MRGKLKWPKERLSDGRDLQSGAVGAISVANALVVTNRTVLPGIAHDRWSNLKAFSACVARRPPRDAAMRAEALS
ncbi:hypothetical protein [Defluviimonas sp. D31]|uniref:hypothetical protein n=1 Tax=Defluviimonas sp. D31 TaxID=3083253 RepID=UPI00296F1065|nr:hypothetical protein [Defluviimonas sp. D31]